LPSWKNYTYAVEKTGLYTPEEILGRILKAKIKPFDEYIGQ
jgi:hypothetical protein